MGHTLRVLAALTAILVEPAGQVGLDAAATAAPAALIVALVLGTEVARGRPAWLLVVAGPAAARAVAGLAVIATDSRLVAGVALLCLAVVAGLAAAARSELRAGGVVTALVAGIPAIGLLSPSPRALAWATVLTGAVIVVGGLFADRTPVAHGGGVVATVGIWQLLGIAEVTAVDAWVLAPALQLWLLGLPGRRAGRLSSWTVDVPPLLLVVVPAVLERLAGGGGWHAVLAGVVAVVAVAGGGLGRHGGPLVVGVVAVVAVVLVETLAVVAAVPTWAWLTVGGAVLLGAGAAIERTGGAPVAGARRLVDVLAERFD